MQANENDEPTRMEVLALYGEAMLAAQEFEEAMIGLVGVREELSVIVRRSMELTPQDIEDLERLWEKLFTRCTAGQLSKKLKLAGSLGEEIEAAVHARNLLAHHYLRDHASGLDRGSGPSVMAASLRTASERFRKLAAALGVERLAAMHDRDLTDDHVMTPGEARRLRYYDPTVDDAVMPEPFGE